MTYLQSPSRAFDVPTGNFSQYDCPSIFNNPAKKDFTFKPQARLNSELGIFVKNCIDEGLEFIKTSRAYPSISNAIDIVCCTVAYNITTNTNTTENQTAKISQVWANNTKRNLKEVCCTLSNIRPSWIYEPNSRKEPEWLTQARIQNGLSDDWYSNSNVDLKLKSLLELGTVEGTGYISPIWNPELNNGQGGIDLKLYRYNEVLPVQIGRDYDLQRAYAVVLIDEMPINRARKTFPDHQHLLVPDRGQARLAKDTVLSAATNKVKGFWDAINTNRKERKTDPSPVVDVLYTYVDDFSINESSQEILMGDFDASGTPITSWSYKVPYLGQLIPNGFNTDGSPKLRKATRLDCKLYPNRRLIIATKTAILYDGPSYWWHGQVPIAKYSPDDWIFSFLGFSLASEIYPLDVASNLMRRDIEDALHLKIDPPVAVDEMSMSKTQAESKSLRTPGKRIRGKLQMGDFIKGILPPETYDVGSDHFAFVQQTEDKMKDLIGLQDLRALMQARQIPSSDTISQFFSQAGAIVTSMSRALDPVMKFIADCNLSYFYQFYDITRRIKILGEEGSTKEDFDFEPATLIPQHLPFEPMRDPRTGAIVSSDGIYNSSRTERARWHLANFRTSIEATSLHQITHMQRKLLLMQATKLYPSYPMVDPSTLAKELDIPNWGNYEGDTIKDKIKSWMLEMEQFQLKSQFDMGKVQLLLQLLAQQGSPEGQATNALSSIAQGLSNNGNNDKSIGPKRVEGRPPEFHQAPELVNKGNRTTITG